MLMLPVSEKIQVFKYRVCILVLLHINITTNLKSRARDPIGSKSPNDYILILISWSLKSINILHILQATLLDIVSASLAFIGLGFMKDGGFYQMLRVSSIIFCAFLSIPVLKQKLRWFNWIGIFIIIAGITLKSVPSIQDFLSADDAKVDGCVGVQEFLPSALMKNSTAGEANGISSSACDETCQTLIGILLIIVSEVIFHLSVVKA